MTLFLYVDKIFVVLCCARWLFGCLVGCFVGVSRSVSMILAHLMSHHRMDLVGAYNHVKSHRL